MAQTYIGSAVRMGSGSLTDAVDGGFAVLAQTTTVATVAAGTASSSTITIPADSQIINIFVDGTTAAVVGGGTATAIAVTVGTAAAGTQYMSSTDGIAGGRLTFAPTAAQTAAMANVGSNQSVVITVDPNGTVSTTQGVFRLTVVYAQKV